MKSEKISTFLQSRIDERDFPSAVYLIAEKDEIIFQDALGYAVVVPEKIEARTDTIYDLASLTKPLVTGLLCAKLIERGEMKLEDKVSKYLDEFGGSEHQAITIENLLVHSSGFAAWKPFYLISNDRFQIPNLIASESLKNPVNSKVLYSDFNFLALTFLIEKLYGKRLDEIANEEIFTPRNLHDTFYNPPRELQKRIAATEKGNEFEKRMCVDLDFDVSEYDWRENHIWGEVHDGNCWFMNGVSGHAGLFSNAFETYKIAQQFLPNTTRLLKSETCKLFRTNFTQNLNEVRSIAFQLAETENSTASDVLSKDSFGHLGFTGTSLWIDPNTERIFILLTNRTHARELPFANINDVRRRFHEIAGSEFTF